MFDDIVLELFKKNWRALKKKAHVVGFEQILRPKITLGVTMDYQSWRIYVDKKVHIDKLNVKDVIPSSFKIGHKSIYTDVIAIGRPKIPPLLKLDKSTQDKWRPLEAGISSMHYLGTACTLNGFFELIDEEKYIQASNYHCYAMEGDAKEGDAVMNPSPYDGGLLPNDKTGGYLFGVPITFDSYECPYRNFISRKLAFWKWFKPAAGINDVDISFATIEPEWVNKIAREYTGFKGYKDPVEGEPVAKCGRTTDRTQGVWETTSIAISVQYRRGIVLMTDVCMADIQCAGGDSGSPMYHPDTFIYNAALFAGSEGPNGRTFGCKISNILRRCEEMGKKIKLIVY